MKNKIRIIAYINLFCLLLSFLVACGRVAYPYENLGDYISLDEKWVEQISVTDEQIEISKKEKIETSRYNQAIEKKITERNVQSGDKVLVNLKCFYFADYEKENAKEITELSGNIQIIIGQNKYPLDLERAITGMSINGKNNVTITLPKNFTVNALSNEKVVFDIELISITELQLPLYNDAYVQSISLCKTVKEYEEEMYKKAKEELYWQKLLTFVTIIQYPSDELNDKELNYVSYYTNLASSNNQSLEEYVAEKFFITLPEFHAQAGNYAKNLVKEELLIYYMARTYDLELTDDEYNEGAEKYAKEYGMRSQSALEAKFGKTFVFQSVQLDKVLEFISKEIDNKKIIEG